MPLGSRQGVLQPGWASDQTEKHLPLAFINAPSSSAKRNATVAECRCLLPFGAALVREFDEGEPHRQTGRQLQELLIFSEVDSAQPYPAQEAVEACRRLAIIYTTLEEEARAKGDMVSWRSKPKLYLLHELIEFTSPEHGSPA